MTWIGTSNNKASGMGRGCMRIAPALGILLLTSPVSAQDIFPFFEAEVDTRLLGTSEFPRPVWMAVIADRQGTRILVGGGDPVFQEKDPRPIAVVRTVGPEGLTVAIPEGGRVVRVSPGTPLPGARDLVFREAALVKTLEYRHRVVPHWERKTLDGDLYMVALRETRAVLQRDLDPPPSPTELMERRLASIQVVQAGPRVWEIDAKDLQAAVESGEAIITDALSRSRVDFSRDTGIGLEVKTPIVEARLDRRGFVITSPNLAQRAGLSVGDRILQVNGSPIDGFGSLIQVYRTLRNDSSVRAVDMLIERDEKPMSLTYRVR